MPDTEVAILNEKQIAEIEARARSASPHYVVDWSKGEHALLQGSGWRPAHEEQPRTIATFDADDGYLDLLFCAEARTDIPALCQTVRALRAREEGHVLITKVDNDTYDRLVALLLDEESELEPGWLLKDADDTLKEIIAERNQLRTQMAQVTGERNSERGLRAELKEIAQAGISEVSSVGTALQENAVKDAVINFRTRAVNLCESKAAEYKRKYPEAAHALRAIAGKLEQL